ncbi:pentapeptide repeat-containing protein [Actinoplanes sp. NPDC026623]|uniref:pentapeptide repeat-containing protein n=1 Tax=Actinoplanes sp. NPDC026623 TaxID=3155610 RepID=UPI0033F3CDFC
MRWPVRLRTGRARPVRGILLTLGAVALGAAFLLLEIRLLWKPPASLLPESPGDTAAATGQFRSAVIQLGVALGAVVALLYTARGYRLARRGQMTERFTKALERLGSPEQYIRIGAIHALDHVMRDSVEHHSDVVELLTAFIRDRAPAYPPEHVPGLWEAAESRWVHPPTGTGARPNRNRSPARVTGDLQAALTSLANRPRRPYSERVRVRLGGLDLSGADLSHASLINADLSGADLSQARLPGADLSGAVLAGTRLISADMTQAILVGTDFSGGDLSRAILTEARLTRADLGRADLRGASMRASTLFAADLRGADLSDATLDAAKLTGADLSGAIVRNASVRVTNLVGATMDGADFGGTLLDDAILQRGASEPDGLHAFGRRLRTALNWLNLTSLAGVGVAGIGRSRLVHAGGILVAGNYRLGYPRQAVFTVGGVVITRMPASWLLDEARSELLQHEVRHTTQYAILGPFFWPLYLFAALWSYVLTGSMSSRNLFERWAGLAAGGYVSEIPLRPWLARLRSR